jgi:hypothetical protein
MLAVEVQLTHGDYTIRLYDDRQYSAGSTDNKQVYQHVYIVDEGFRPSSQHAIRVFRGTQELSSAIVGAAAATTGIHEHSYCIQSDFLLICAGNYLFNLHLPDLSLSWNIEVDEATAFGVHPLREDVIVHGELSISRVGLDGRIVWQHSGSDIFTTAEGENTFRIENEIIYAKSWDYREYRFSYDGRVL